MTLQARGAKARLLLDFESTFGVTPATPAGIIIPIKSADLQGTQTLIESEIIRDSRMPIRPDRGNYTLAGPVVGPIDSTVFGYILKAMMGVPVTTGSSPNYSHVFKPGAVQPSLTMEQGHSDIGFYKLINGCKVSSIAISLAPNQELLYTANVVGSIETRGATSYDATPTTVAITKRFSNYQASILEGGGAIATVTKLDVTIDFGLDDTEYCLSGGGIRSDIPEGMVKVTGTLSALFTDASLLTKAANKTESSLQLTLTYDANTSLVLLVPELEYELKTPGIKDAKGIVQDLGWYGFYATNVDATVVKFTLNNQNASYA